MNADLQPGLRTLTSEYGLLAIYVFAGGGVSVREPELYGPG
jgi:hypothetical protein